MSIVNHHIGQANQPQSAPTLRRLARRSALALAALVALALLLIAAFAARLAVGPVSIGFLATDIRESINERLYYAYDVEFDDALIDWRKAEGLFEVRLVEVQIHDYSTEVIGSVPAIAAAVPIEDLIAGRAKPSELRLERPVIRWIATAGGAVKFDIGGARPGISGKILEDILITLAAAPDPEADASRETAPRVLIQDADITIASELDGSRIHAPHATIVASPDAKGVRTLYDLSIESDTGRPIGLVAESLFRTADQRIELHAEVEGVRPRELAALAPGLTPIAGLDAPASGTFSVEMDKFFGIGAGDFDLRFGKGALALPDWGVTLPIEGGNARGNLGNDARRLTLDRLELEFQAARLIAEGMIDGDGRRREIAFNGTLEGEVVAPLRRRWPAAIAGNMPDWLAALADDAGPFRLALAGQLDRSDGTLALAGRFGSPPATLEVLGTWQTPVLNVSDR